jgi:hypothetical protein
LFPPTKEYQDGEANIRSLLDAKELRNHIKFFKMMKTCQMSIKQNTQQRGQKKKQDGRTQVLAKGKYFKTGGSLRE